MGWGVFYLGQKSECHNEECSHGCGSKGNASKKAASIVLKAATALFIANLLIYAVFHKGLGFSASSVYEQTAVHEADHEHRN